MGVVMHTAALRPFAPQMIARQDSANAHQTGHCCGDLRLVHG
jgi:hypothetical protein